MVSYEREIREAQSMALMASRPMWAMVREPYYIRYTAQMFEAAYRLHSGFRLTFSDVLRDQMDDVEDMLRP